MRALQKMLVVIAAIVMLSSLPSRAEATPKRPTKTRVRAHRAKPRTRPTRARTADGANLALHDEVPLTPALIKKIQLHLIDGGDLDGTVDGRLTTRTRQALALFQTEYHLRVSGTVDRATANALLGPEEISAADPQPPEK